MDKSKNLTPLEASKWLRDRNVFVTYREIDDELTAGRIKRCQGHGRNYVSEATLEKYIQKLARGTARRTAMSIPLACAWLERYGIHYSYRELAELVDIGIIRPRAIERGIKYPTLEALYWLVDIKLGSEPEPGQPLMPHVDFAEVKRLRKDAMQRARIKVGIKVGRKPLG